MTPPRAVTFDFWHTLVAERPGHMRELQLDHWEVLLAEAGEPRSRDAIGTTFAANWERFVDRWHTNEGQYTPADAAAFLMGALDVAPRDGLVERLTDTFRLVGEEATLQVASGLAPCLARLRDAGVRLGIVCDVGLTSSPTLRDRLEQLGVLEAFDAWAFSDETGWFKPAAAAFRPALDGLGVDPGDAAHVGDNERTDIAGALALGMRAVRFVGLLRWSGLLDEGPATSSLGVPVIEDLEELPALLEVP